LADMWQTDSDFQIQIQEWFIAGFYK